MILFKRRSTKAIIAQIHNEFNTASDRLLKEAQQIANSADEGSIAKGKRLSALGFVQTRESVKSAEQEAARVKYAEHIQWANYYHEHYPFNRFIVEDQVKVICEKYGLVHGPVARYKGFVPEKNLQQIEQFKLREEDVAYVMQTLTFSENGPYFSPTNISKEVWDLLQQGTYYRKSRGRDLEICAPVKDFDQRGTRILGYKLSAIPDPVVLQPVLGGYLCVAQWGEEASDENVINKINN